MTVLYGPDGRPISGIVGNVAHDAADAGNPVKIGGIAYDLIDSPQTPVAGAGYRVNAQFGLHGELAVAIVDPATGLPANNNTTVQGDIVAGEADEGRPVKIGGRAHAGPTAVDADSDRVDAWFTKLGAVVVAADYDGTTGSDAVGAINSLPGRTNTTAGAGTVPLAAGVYLYNGTTWDRLRGDVTNGLDVDVTRLPALVAGSANIGDVDVASIAAGDNNIGNVDVVTLPALVAGSANIGDVDVLTLPNVNLAASTNTIEVVGDVAEDVALAGNPQRVGFRASTAIPTAMSADNDIVTPWANRSGAPVVTQAPHVGLNADPWSLVHEAAQYTTTQTSAVLVAGGASEKIVVTKVQIQVGGTTAGAVQLYFGTGAYSRGTSRAIFDGEFAPSATLKPGVVMDGPFIAGTNGDDLMVTTSAAINPITFSIWYYVVV